MKTKNQTKVRSNDFEINLNRALRFLSFRPRSEKEIIDYLKKKSSFAKASEGQARNELESIINAVIKKLKEHKFLNDKEFVKWWIEQRTKIKPRSSRFIKFELKQKGINYELIDEGLSQSDETDFEKAKKLAEKRMPRYSKIEEKRKIYEKLFRFLSSKGFDYDTIKQVIDQVLSKEYNVYR
jgi:regulatory protein